MIQDALSLSKLCTRTRQNGVRGVYSIGRVQTPTLYMVYQRDQAIKNFKPEPYFELNAEILANQQKFFAKLDPLSAV